MSVPVDTREIVAITRDFQDIHVFDPEISVIPASYPQRPPEEIHRAIDTLIQQHASLGLSDAAVAAMRVIQQDIGSDNNKLGFLRADAMLAELALQSSKAVDYARVLNQQLEDMHSGFCPSGRVTRIYQVYHGFVDPAEPTTK